MNFAESTQHLNPVQTVLRGPSVRSSGAALPHKDNGVGFSVSTIFPFRSLEILRDDVQDLNLPISLAACVLVTILLDLPTPPGSSQEKFMRLDWM